MGQRQNQDEIVYGNDCLLGFDAGETPKYLYVRFSGLIKCAPWLPPEFNVPPNDHTFTLTQDEENACHWFYLSDDWGVDFWVVAGPVRVRLTLGDVVEGTFYFDEWIAGVPDENNTYYNDYQVCIHPRGAHKGFASVTWRLESLLILDLINMDTADDLFMEMQPVDDGSRVYKYRRLQDATNIAIKYEPD